MPKFDRNAPPFRAWAHSDANPLHNASDQVRYFSADALEAAFHAGMAYQKRLHRENRVRLAREDDMEDTFK